MDIRANFSESPAGFSWLNHAWHRRSEQPALEMAGGGRLKQAMVWTASAALALGIIIHLFLPAK